MLKSLSKIRMQTTESIFYDDNRYTTHDTIDK